MVVDCHGGSPAGTGPLNKWVSGQNYRVEKHDASLCIIILGCIFISRIMKFMTIMDHYHTHE